MYKYEEKTFMFSKKEVVEALKKNFGIVGSLIDIQFGTHNLEDQDHDFLTLIIRNEYGGDYILTEGPIMLEEGSFD